jgi:hypothetical protein
VEVTLEYVQPFEAHLAGLPFAQVGTTTTDKQLRIAAANSATPLIAANLDELKEAWQRPLRW